MFKAGDMVRCLDNEFYNKRLTNGKVYRIALAYMDADTEYVQIENDDQNTATTNCYSSRFELVTEQNKLDGLIKTANDGLVALSDIWNNHLDNVVFKDDNTRPGSYLYVQNKGKARALEIKKLAKLFVPYKTSNGWQVEKNEDDRIKIGCITFYLETIHKMLDGFVRRGFKYFEMNSCVFNLVFGGIQYGQHVLPHKDAIELLNKLDEYKKE